MKASMVFAQETGLIGLADAAERVYVQDNQPLHLFAKTTNNLSLSLWKGAHLL